MIVDSLNILWLLALVPMVYVGAWVVGIIASVTLVLSNNKMQPSIPFFNTRGSEFTGIKDLLVIAALCAAVFVTGEFVHPAAVLIWLPIWIFWTLRRLGSYS